MKDYPPGERPACGRRARLTQLKTTLQASGEHRRMRTTIPIRLQPAVVAGAQEAQELFHVAEQDCRPAIPHLPGGIPHLDDRADQGILPARDEAAAQGLDIEDLFVHELVAPRHVFRFQSGTGHQDHGRLAWAVLGHLPQAVEHAADSLLGNVGQAADARAVHLNDVELLAAVLFGHQDV